MLRSVLFVFISLLPVDITLAADAGKQLSPSLAPKAYGQVLVDQNTSSLPASVKADIKRLAPKLKSEQGGACVVFVGESGTVKTQAASLLATSLGKRAYRVDFAAVTSKYIGETEKNLKRLLDSAMANNWILVFDEADALFGKRTEVKDSHDRYANSETNYLLERLEAYNGIWVLTSNSHLHLDSGLKHHCRHIVKL